MAIIVKYFPDLDDKYLYIAIIKPTYRGEYQYVKLIKESSIDVITTFLNNTQAKNKRKATSKRPKIIINVKN